MAEPQMPDPSDHPKVRRWRALYELGTILCGMPDVDSAHIGYHDSALLILDDGVVQVTHDDLTLTLEQIPGYIEALEGDVLDAQAEVRRMRAAAGEE
jgi:hypothetical protein